jgi:hypothetical protein
MSEQIRELYDLLTDLKRKDNKEDRCYLRFIVQNGGRDYMFLLLQQLEEMKNKLEE